MKVFFVIFSSFVASVILVFPIMMCNCYLELVDNFDFQTSAKTGGLAVTDFDQDGIFEVIVAISDGPNLVLQYSPERNSYIDIGEEMPDYSSLRDAYGPTITVCACDVDGDGGEEIFLMNQKSPLDNLADTQPNRLLKYNNGTITDLLSDPDNFEMASSFSGGFVTCIDHDGDGIYAILMGSYVDDGSGDYKVFSVQNRRGPGVVLRDVSQDIGLDVQRDGTSCLIGPLLNEGGYPDIFMTNSNSFYVGSNFYRSNNSNIVFQNQRNGRFIEAPELLYRQDDFHSYHSAAIADLNGDVMVDLLVCSFYGPVWKYIRNPRTKEFQIGIADNFTKPAGCKNLLAADFDNDGKVEVFKDDKKNDGSNENAVFEAESTDDRFGVSMEQIDIGDHLNNVNVQGITIADLNRDGVLELIIAHKQYSGRTLSIYQSLGTSINNWLRVMPLTYEGAPTRGAKVTLTLNDFRTITTVIGGGCSRACQTEPVAHFGMGSMAPFHIEVTWPDGHAIRQFLSNREVRRTLQVSYTGHVVYLEELMTHSHYVSNAAYREVYSFNLILCSFICFIRAVKKGR